MKTITKNISENYKLIIIVAVVAIIIGYALGSSKNENRETLQHEHTENAQSQTWTCSMHPQIKQDKPGLCPICAMDLVPLSSMQASGDGADINEISMSESAIELASIQTMVVSSGKPQKSVRVQGKIQEDERNVAELTARFAGRIEKLLVNFTGQNVRKGQKLATIYSADLVTAQRELLESANYLNKRPSLYNAARAKLKLWNLSEEQIDSIERSSKPQLYFDILSPIAGTVTRRYVSQGDYVKEGAELFRVVDLTSVWALFDAYESDLPWIKIGDQMTFSVQSLPGKTYTGNVSFIDPFIDSKTRVAKVRVDLNNSDQKLKPEMFTAGVIESVIAGSENEILIPKTALLWTGKRAVVYVKVPNRDNPTFLYREIVLGPEAGNFYVVAEGLESGEEIAVNGVFKIDAAAQLQGLSSMMNPLGGEGSTPHDMSKMNTSSSNQSTNHNVHSMDLNAESSLSNQEFTVYGNCGMCKTRIEQAATSLEGVVSANWDPKTKQLKVTFDKAKTQLNEIHQVITLVGHDTDKFRAADDVYEKLHTCCKYERAVAN